MSRFALCTLLLACAVSGCGDSPTTADPELPPAITDVYEGTLTPNGAERFSFVTAISGSTTATITALSPDTAVVGLGLGTYTQSTGLCQVLLANDAATLNSTIQGQSDRAGNLCVRVYDVGRLTDAVPYKIQVVHY